MRRRELPLIYSRVRYQVKSVAPVDFVSEGLKLAELIKQYDGMGIAQRE